MQKKEKKGFIKSCLVIAVAFAMLAGQTLNANAVTVGVGLETGDLPDPNVVKTVQNLSRSDGTTVIGDTLQYTITVSNDEEFSTWKNVTAYDAIPSGLNFDYSSGVMVNGTSADFGYNTSSRELSVYLGNLAGPDETLDGIITEKDVKVITFKAVVNDSAYKSTIYNTVSVEGENGDGEDTDDGTYVGSLAPIVDIKKAATNVTSGKTGTAVVGDVLEYAITLQNNQPNSEWTNVVVTDTIPSGVDFDGNTKVYVNGAEVSHTYNAATRELSVSVGNIEGGKADGTGKGIVVVKFQVTVNESSYNSTVYNTAVAEGDNGGGGTTDPGVDVVSDEPSIVANKVVKNLSRASKKGQIGDRVRYTITVANNQINSAWKNVYVYDTIPVEVDFDPSTKVLVNGQEVSYTYNAGTRMLIVRLGDVTGGQSDGSGKVSYELVFESVVNEVGYDKVIYNTADILSVAARNASSTNNIGTISVTDKGLTIGK